MFRIMFRVWFIMSIIFFFSHILFTNYVKQSVEKSLRDNGYNYIAVSSASLSYDALIGTKSEGYLRATMDGREIILKLNVAGNPIWSRKLIVNVATPMGRLRVDLGTY